MRGSSSNSGGVLMEFGAAEVPPPPTAPGVVKTSVARTNASNSEPRLQAVGSSSSLSSTAYEDDTESPVSTAASSSAAALPTSTTTSSVTASAPTSTTKAAGGFEASKFFRFSDFGARGDADFFAAPEFSDDASDNNEVLPPRVVSPTNQTTHDAADAREAADVVTQPAAARPPALGARGASLGSRPRPIQPPATIANRRKNSIEMFLSQSPSQALGGGFLKMALDDHLPPPAHRLPPRRHEGGGSVRTGVVAINQPPPPQQQQPLELDPREAERGNAKDPSTGLSGQPAATTSSYGYLLSHSPPAVDTDDEWSSTSSQEMLGAGSNSSATAYYYAESQAALHQSHQQQQPYAGYGSGAVASNYRYAPDSYGATTRPAPPAQQVHQHTSWGASPAGVASQSPYGASTQSSYAAHSAGATNAASGFPHYQQQTQAPAHHYQQQQQSQSVYHQQQHGGHRAPSQRSYGRSQSMYVSSSSGRMMMMESSPPPSPHTSAGSHYAVKQCKFFLQGHCRMGNKCKFAHHPPAPHSSPAASPYHHQQQQHHQSQSFHVPQASPASSPHHHQQHHSSFGPQLTSHEFDAFSSSGANQSSYMPRSGSSRQSYRMGGSEMSMSSPAMTMTPHPVQHHALAGLQSTMSIAAGPAQVTPVDAMLKFEDVQGRVFSMSKDQNGCRLLQEQLEYYDERKALCDLIYTEAMDHLAEMMVDPFGNYLFQKLLERAKPLQRLEIVRRVGGHLVAAALNLHGTRSVQKVVEVCATSAQVVELASDGSELRRVNLPDLIVEALKDDAVRLCIDSNGNHVIQRALQFMKPEYNQFVFDAVCKECTTVGTHRHGCCVLQRCLDAANDQQKREVITQVEKQAMKLMQDPYGNYVVQYVLDSCTAEEAYGVIVKPLGNVFELSIQKFSSNVIEKCLEKAPPSVLKEYVDEITLCPKMQKMLQDQFANYVVQRALSVSAEDQCLALVKAIRPHLPAMKNTSGGRRITARILKRFPHMDLNLDLGFEPAALGASYAMGGMTMQQYAPHHSHQQQHYDSSYAMPFASTSATGSLGFGLHSGGSMMDNGGGAPGRM